MPIDTSMYGQIQPMKLESPVNMLMQGMQIKQAQNQNRLADLAFAEKERAIADDQAVRDVYAKFGTGKEALPELAKISPTAYRAEAKSQAELSKAEREAKKAQYDQAKEELDLVGRIVATAKDQNSYSQGLAVLQARGVDVSAIPQQYSPEYVAKAGQWALSRAQQLDQAYKQMDFAEKQRHNRSTEGIAGANLGLRREEIGLKRQEVAGGGKAPAGYRWKQDGSLEPIPGGPAEKESAGTEGERTASGYGLRMQEAEKIIGSVAAKDAKSQKPGAIEAVTGPGIIANVTSSSNRQQYRQAQEDWVRAKLRKESGAVIGEEEMKREIMTYFPQPGDKPEVIEQKAGARKVAMEAMKTSAGKAGKNLSAPTGGIKFLGFE
jgi:hypothetical protein